MQSLNEIVSSLLNELAALRLVLTFLALSFALDNANDGDWVFAAAWGVVFVPCVYLTILSRRSARRFDSQVKADEAA